MFELVSLEPFLVQIINMTEIFLWPKAKLKKKQVVIFFVLLKHKQIYRNSNINNIPQLDMFILNSTRTCQCFLKIIKQTIICENFLKFSKLIQHIICYERRTFHLSNYLDIVKVNIYNILEDMCSCRFIIILCLFVM